MGGGRYLAVPPPGWDSKSRLAASIFFHGWQSSAEAFARDRGFTAAFAREGVLLILPDGLGKTWAHQGSPSTARDEIAFMDAVRSDMLRRWPIDPGEILVAGFSQGGSMAWDLACRRGGDYAAFVAVSGAFWEPLPAGCTGPVNLLHIHGTADPVVPMEGRSIRGTWRQGDVLAGLAVLREADGCAAQPSRSLAEQAGLSCQVWDGCASGRELRLCRHGDGHLMPEGWVAVAHAWARGLRSRSEGG